MPVLKALQIDDIKDVTVIVFSQLAFREKYTPDGRIHVVISEAHKTEDDTLVELSGEKSICKSTTTSHIDVLLDFPSAEKIDKLIEYLLEVKKGANEQH